MSLEALQGQVPPRRILVLRPRALGDVLLTTPALRALKASFPAAALHVAVDDLLAPLLQRNPHLDRLWLLPRRRPRRQRDWWKLAWALRRQRFDLVVDLHGSPRTALLARFTGAPQRVGYALRGRGRLYTHRIPRDTDRRGRRVTQYAARVNLEFVARCGAGGAALDDTSLVYVPAPEAEARMAQALSTLAPGPRVGIAAAGTWQAKTYPPESFAQVGVQLARAGCRVLLVWGPGERQRAAAVGAAMGGEAILAPETNLDELAALLARLDLLVANDSGVKHLAVARGTPTLTVCGPTSPTAWVADDPAHAWVRACVPCLECNFTACAHHSCMRLLAPAAVAERALRLLELRRGSTSPP